MAVETGPVHINTDRLGSISKLVNIGIEYLKYTPLENLTVLGVKNPPNDK